MMGTTVRSSEASQTRDRCVAKGRDTSGVSGRAPLAAALSRRDWDPSAAMKNADVRDDNGFRRIPGGVQ